MTKAIRIENADTSDHKVTVQLWGKTEAPELIIHPTRYLVVKQA